MKAKTKKLLTGALIAATALAGGAGTLVAQEKPVIATVVKISGIPWFDRMNTGVEAYQKANPDVVATHSSFRSFRIWSPRASMLWLSFRWTRPFSKARSSAPSNAALLS